MSKFLRSPVGRWESTGRGPFLPLGSPIEGTTQTIIALIGPIRPARWSSRPRKTSRRCRQGVARCSVVRCLLQDRRVRDLPGQGWPLRPDDASPRLRGDAAAARGLSTDVRSGLGAGRPPVIGAEGGRAPRTDQLLIEVVKAGRVRFPIGKTAFEEAHDPPVSTTSACLGRTVMSWLPPSAAVAALLCWHGFPQRRSESHLARVAEERGGTSADLPSHRTTVVDICRS
jgi:hypothetical protein